MLLMRFSPPRHAYCRRFYAAIRHDAAITMPLSPFFASHTLDAAFFRHSTLLIFFCFADASRLLLLPRHFRRHDFLCCAAMLFRADALFSLFAYAAVRHAIDCRCHFRFDAITLIYFSFHFRAITLITLITLISIRR